MRFKPDWEGASALYDRAANLTNAARAYEHNINANTKLARAMLQIRSYFQAAKAFEAAANSARMLKDMKQASDLYKKSVELYRQNGTNDTAVQVLEKAAKYTEEVDPLQAAQMYLDAIDIQLAEGKKRQVSEAFRRAAALFLNANKTREAVKALQDHLAVLQEINQLEVAHKNILAIVVVFLKAEDYVAADKAAQDGLSVQRFAMSDEGKAAFDLLEAYDKGDAKGFEAVTKRQVFSFLDNEICKVARNLRVGGSTMGASSTSSQPAPAGRNELFARSTPAPVATPAAPVAPVASAAPIDSEPTEQDADADNEASSLFSPTTAIPTDVAPAAAVQSAPAAPQQEDSNDLL
ncbi:hypothetical protein, variant 1 [Capsaspora owczarzaki ATCC 30864]|nr:hypothetical protein, variant 1 [Capsaspora owczarzaki ATCC 30864]